MFFSLCCAKVAGMTSLYKKPFWSTCRIHPHITLDFPCHVPLLPCSQWSNHHHLILTYHPHSNWIRVDIRIRRCCCSWVIDDDKIGTKEEVRGGKGVPLRGRRRRRRATGTEIGRISIGNVYVCACLLWSLVSTYTKSNIVSVMHSTHLLVLIFRLNLPLINRFHTTCKGKPFHSRYKTTFKTFKIWVNGCQQMINNMSKGVSRRISYLRCCITWASESDIIWIFVSHCCNALEWKHGPGWEI